MLFKLKTKILTKLFGKMGVFATLTDFHEGCVILSDDKGAKDVLKGVLLSQMRNGNYEVRKMVLDCAAEYLKPLEVDARNFIKRIK